ncbi:D-alanyl-D-alanine carboxypeptidase family protein [Tenuibacillus multivorans]|uniref:serine-type D-Ala-D-Ala carboxypeptidase n=1 Tax=Tenuibacillus multivorans TaxID=237069 RepID=A0A1G9W520_9BACI|nr:D-alanyl-D-alanine carboxypeptidase family protein [Tenuibacillus multivorans]GEL76314.1 D-alanyl-D-alanine carboxypeptidase [Tenuibacillus multivorans]SDM79589.1 D-alanyl-D-alanine carboxypeptidase (penicillin-binding protein 5/6) [Tenuibacillus multivorans]
MKKKLHVLRLIILIVMFTFSSFIINPQLANASSLDIQAESAILVDADTGEILFEKEADIALPPASMTKMMTEYLVLEAINNGSIDWETTTQITEYAYEVSSNPLFSGIGLRLDHPYTVKELYDAMVIYSDNATTIALAELIAGSEAEFVNMMNEKAEEMGLTDYKFVNSTGLPNSTLGDNYPEGTDPEGENLMSASDTAKLAYHLLKDYPEVLDVSSVPTKEFEGHEMINYNWMLPNMPGHLAQFSYDGLDGLKTGHTDLAGYTFTGTAERNGKRMISVVMRTESKQERFNETRKLLDYGFNNFETVTLYDQGHQIEDKSVIEVEKGQEDQVEIEANQAIETTVKNGEQENYSVTYEFHEDVLTEDGTLVAPVEEGLEVGQMVLTYNGENEYGNIVNDEQISVPLVTTEGVEKSNWFVLLLQGIGDFFVNLFASIKGLFT